MIRLLSATLRKLRRDRSGVAFVEFALSVPFLLFAGLWGAELANYAIVNMRISQLAQQIADNASRIGDTALLENRRIYEADISDLLKGAEIQGGTQLGLFEHGRVIISSVEDFQKSDHCQATGIIPVCPVSGVDEGTPFIHWQRCLGVKNAVSEFGPERTTLPDGIGPEGRKVKPIPGTPVIYVEVDYDYQPLISARFVGRPLIHSVASYLVRDNRDLSQVYIRSNSPRDKVADCAKLTVS